MEIKHPKIPLLKPLKFLIALKLLNQGFQGKKGILRHFKQIFKAFDILLIKLAILSPGSKYSAL